LRKIERTLESEYWDSVEIPILKKDGEIRAVLWNSDNIFARDGRTVIATVVVTRRRELRMEVFCMNILPE